MDNQSEKLKSILHAHLDGVYMFSARKNCDHLVTALIQSNLKTIKENEWLKRQLAEHTGDAPEIHKYVNLAINPGEKSRVFHPTMPAAIFEAKRIQEKTGKKMMTLKVKKVFPKTEGW